MLESFKKKGSSAAVKQQVDDLKELILSAQMERTALNTALSQVELHAPKVATMGGLCRG